MKIINYKLESVYVALELKHADSPYSSDMVNFELKKFLHLHLVKKGIKLEIKDMSDLVESIARFYEVKEATYKTAYNKLFYTLRPRIDNYRIAINTDIDAISIFNMREATRE